MNSFIPYLKHFMNNYNVMGLMSFQEVRWGGPPHLDAKHVTNVVEIIFTHIMNNCTNVFLKQHHGNKRPFKRSPC